MRPGSPRFYQLVDEIADLHAAKNQDYADADDPFRNFRSSEAVGVPAWIGGLVRLNDKVMRINGFAKRRTLAVKDEQIEDTLKDLAVYALIVLALYEEASSSPAGEAPPADR